MPGRRARSKISGAPRTTSAVSRIIGNVTTAISPRCSIRRSEVDRATRTKIARCDERQGANGRARSRPMTGSRRRRKRPRRSCRSTITSRRFAAARRQAIGRRAAFYSTLFNTRAVSCAPVTRCPKPNGERFPEFRDSNKESLELELFSTQPIYEDLEHVKLTDSLTDMATRFGCR